MKKAFTLAEVLITLTIIGVIAALTIPNLMKNYKNHLTITKLQKAYNILGRAAANIKMNTGVDKLEDTGWRNLSRKEFLEKFVEAAQIKDAKIYHNTNYFKVKYLYCEKQTCTDSTGAYPNGVIITQDNFIIAPEYNGYDTVGRRLNTFVGLEYKLKDGRADAPGNQTRLWQYHMGRNAFYFTIDNNFDVKPYSSASKVLSEENKSSIYRECDDAKTGYGYSCAARILLDGWKIKY